MVLSREGTWREARRGREREDRLGRSQRGTEVVAFVVLEEVG